MKILNKMLLIIAMGVVANFTTQLLSSSSCYAMFDERLDDEVVDEGLNNDKISSQPNLELEEEKQLFPYLGPDISCFYFDKDHRVIGIYDEQKEDTTFLIQSKIIPTDVVDKMMFCKLNRLVADCQSDDDLNVSYIS